jgi:hypothetical protein
LSDCERLCNHDIGTQRSGTVLCVSTRMGSFVPYSPRTTVTFTLHRGLVGVPVAVHATFLVPVANLACNAPSEWMPTDQDIARHIDSRAPSLEPNCSTSGFRCWLYTCLDSEVISDLMVRVLHLAGLTMIFFGAINASSVGSRRTISSEVGLSFPTPSPFAVPACAQASSSLH